MSFSLKWPISKPFHRKTSEFLFPHIRPDFIFFQSVCVHYFSHMEWVKWSFMRNKVHDGIIQKHEFLKYFLVYMTGNFKSWFELWQNKTPNFNFKGVTRQKISFYLNFENQMDGGGKGINFFNRDYAYVLIWEDFS